MKQQQNLQQILHSQIDNLAVTLRPKTIENYATIVQRFVRFLQHMSIITVFE